MAKLYLVVKDSIKNYSKRISIFMILSMVLFGGNAIAETWRTFDIDKSKYDSTRHELDLQFVYRIGGNAYINTRVSSSNIRSYAMRYEYKFNCNKQVHPARDMDSLTLIVSLLKASSFDKKINNARYNFGKCG